MREERSRDKRNETSVSKAELADTVSGSTNYGRVRSCGINLASRIRVLPLDYRDTRAEERNGCAKSGTVLLIPGTGRVCRSMAWSLWQLDLNRICHMLHCCCSFTELHGPRKSNAPAYWGNPTSLPKEITDPANLSHT